MDKLFTIILLSIITIPTIFGQTIKDSSQCTNVAGVYLTSEDFKTSTLNKDSICTDNKDNKLKIGWIGSIDGHIGGKITLVEGDVKKKYNYDSIFGFLYNGDKYRLQKRVLGSSDAFKIIDTSGLIIYSQEDPGSPFSFYFYSTEINTDIKSLRFKNLKKDFPDKRNFLTQVRECGWKMLVKKSENGNLIINEHWNKYAR